MAKKRKTRAKSGKPQISSLDHRGREIPDSAPLQPAVGISRAPSLAERIRELVRSEKLAQLASEAGAETFEEADDFDVGDDYDPESPYEEFFEGEFDVLREQRIEAELAKLRASRRSRQRMPEPDASDGAEPIQPHRAGSALLDASDGESPTSEGGRRRKGA